MEALLTDTLCTRCGLCCDGTLFADVELASRAEATRVEALGLEIESDDDAPLLVQPCAALRGRRCSIYVHRPGFRTPECKPLLDATWSGEVERAGTHLAGVESSARCGNPSSRWTRRMGCRSRSVAEALWT
jgi:hypothetical protein